ncbi:hypothetical protein AIE52_22825, partial [Salmonella enterica subsp. enterica serovar Senftenberg]|nr:hypothetical protein [Salmonella enterica subsp. enterica serovar Senftenberg]
ARMKSDILECFKRQVGKVKD